MQPDAGSVQSLAQCAPAAPVVFGTLADMLRPAERLTVSAWAAKYRVVSAESGSRHPGLWRNERTPHLVDVMDALGADDPAEDVVFVASAQVGKSEVGVNFFGYVVDQDPGPMIIVLPSFDEGNKYVRTKLQPAIDETPRLRSRVLEMASRGERGSTAAYKRFRGGFAQVTFAGSSKGLQMLSARYTLGDEVSEWPAEAGQRGDPVSQLKKRTEIYTRDRKRFWPSTPSVAGSCRVTEMYQRSDRRRRYVPCPHCGDYQVLKFDHLKWRQEAWPPKAYFECQSNGCVIEHLDKAHMMAAGRWIATAGDDGPGLVIPAAEIETWAARHVPTRVRGFHIWKAYSLFTDWDEIVAEWLEARDNHERMRVFTQQVLGEAWEEKGEAPDAEALHKRRVIEFAKGNPPVGPVVFTGATDVQGNRLEWAVWGWSEGMTRWLVDWGVIEGDPMDLATWARHDEMMMTRRYSPGGLGRIEVEAWAVDSGYSSHAVYHYSRGRQRVFAIDGRDGRTEPMVGTPRKVDVKWNGRRVRNGAVLWPVGTYALKSDHYAAIRRTINGPDEDGIWPVGAAILPGDVDLGMAEQLTSEYLKAVETRSGMVTHRWAKLAGRPNEALDIAGYARAMAYHLRLDLLTSDQWQALRAERCPPVAAGGQADLFEIAVAAPTPAQRQAAGPAARPRRRGVRGEAR